ncbi:hypothetical protein Dimus_035803 [Dionaea muscipula]
MPFSMHFASIYSSWKLRAFATGYLKHTLKILLLIYFNISSYWYEFDSNNWSTVYKHTMGKDYRFKVGYDSKESVGSASLWVSLCNIMCIRWFGSAIYHS